MLPSTKVVTAASPPKWTLVVGVNPEPVSVTAVPPRGVPVIGASEASAGAGATVSAEVRVSLPLRLLTVRS